MAVGNRTFGVNTFGGSDGYYRSNMNSYGFTTDDFYIDQSPDATLQMEDINVEGDSPITRIKPDLGGQTELSGVMQASDVTPPPKDTTVTGYLERAEQERARATTAANATRLMAAAGNITNAISKYNQIEFENNYNIQQAKLQTMQVIANSRYEQLRTMTKGEAAGDKALLSAVARGQAAQGDLARTAVSNEEVYAAQNAMIQEINSMREVFGLESKMRQLQSATRIAEINRNKEIADNAMMATIAFI